MEILIRTQELEKEKAQYKALLKEIKETPTEKVERYLHTLSKEDFIEIITYRVKAENKCLSRIKSLNTEINSLKSEKLRFEKGESSLF